MKAKQVLEVDYNEKQGLMLSWSYTDLNTYLTFFRHVLVLFTEDNQNAKSFIKTYLKRLRSGDLYLILYCDHEGKLKAKRWRQKTNMEQTQDFNDIIKEDIMIGDKQTMMAKVEQQFDHFTDPIVVSCYTDSLEFKSYFQARVYKQRSNQKYDFIVGIFGPFTQANLSFADQVNIIPFLPDLRSEAVQFYLTHVYQAAVLWASVSIQCLNAQITSSSQRNWKNVYFNTVQRIYRGPSIKYERDFLHFFENKKNEAKYNMLLKLTYVTLERRKFYSEKQFTIHTFGGFNKLTFSIAHWNKPYHACGDFWLSENPFRSLTILKFQRQNAERL